MTVTRSEKDFLGSKDIPIDAYYGVHTARAFYRIRRQDQSLSTFYHCTGHG